MVRPPAPIYAPVPQPMYYVQQPPQPQVIYVQQPQQVVYANSGGYRRGGGAAVGGALVGGLLLGEMIGHRHRRW